MKRFLLAAVLALAAVPALAQVGVAINVGAPDFYGQIVIGGAPAPQLIYAQPVVVAPAPQYVGAAPIYLRVPPGQAKHWRKYCKHYGACGRPVYFVRDDWYRGQYVPYYRAHHGDRDWKRGGPGGKQFDRGHDRKEFKHGGRGNNGHHRGRDD